MDGCAHHSPKTREKREYRLLTLNMARRKLTVMMNAPYKDRIEFWKLQHASSTFDQVTQLCEWILKEGIDGGHPLHVPLMAALHTLYGRPFRQRKDFRIAEDLVPANYRDDHVMLLTMRDKIHAHTDADGPKTTDDDCLNKCHGHFQRWRY